MSFALYRWLGLVAACGVLGLPPAVAQQMVSVPGEDVNLRSGPGKQHPAEWMIGGGYPLRIVGRRGDWLEVRDFENDKGWIHRQLIASTPYHIVKVKVANMRSQPTTSARIIAKFVYGETLRTLERKSDWVKVQRPGGPRGWIARRLLWGW